MIYGWGMDSWGIVGWIAMALLMVLFWGSVIAFIIVVLRRNPSDRGTLTRASQHEAERILSERFARGEIDETEYLARRTALRSAE